MQMRIDTPAGPVSAALEGESKDLVVLAHGAGGNMDARLVLRLRDMQLEHGFSVARFNFAYKEQRKGLPDKMPVLMETFAAVVAHLRALHSPERLVCAGHSMGGRTASMLAADGFAMDALFCFGYPLHPAGKPDKLRDEHLPRIEVPTLIVNGTRDELCRVDLMEAVLPRLRSCVHMRWIPEGDHSLHVPRSSGTNDAAVLREIGQWCRALVEGKAPATAPA